MAYATADLDAIIAKLEKSLALGTAEVQFEGRRLVYRSVADIRAAITYFKSLYDEATDAPRPTVPKVRMYLGYPNKGFGNF
jgi:hypothetical protein